MVRRNPAWVGTFLAVLSLALGATAQAQSNAPAPTSQSASASNPSPAANSGAAAPAESAPATKKVWTNDDLGNLRSGSSISTFQGKSGTRKAAPAKPAPGDKRGNANWYRVQIAKLQARIPPLDAKIAQLQAAIAGQSVNDPKTSSRPYGGVKPGDWRMQLNQYQADRDALLAKISALQDQARHAGVPENDIP